MIARFITIAALVAAILVAAGQVATAQEGIEQMPVLWTQTVGGVTFSCVDDHSDVECSYAPRTAGECEHGGDLNSEGRCDYGPIVKEYTLREHHCTLPVRGRVRCVDVYDDGSIRPVTPDESIPSPNSSALRNAVIMDTADREGNRQQLGHGDTITTASIRPKSNPSLADHQALASRQTAVYNEWLNDNPGEDPADYPGYDIVTDCAGTPNATHCQAFEAATPRTLTIEVAPGEQDVRFIPGHGWVTDCRQGSQDGWRYERAEGPNGGLICVRVRLVDS